MWFFRNSMILWVLGLVGMVGCINPFAPELGETGNSQVPDASTIGGMLELFEYAYNTHDSLFYSQVLDSSFVFEYYDVANSRYDQWYRTTDLQATAKLFRSYESIDLNWYKIPDPEWNFAVEDSVKQIIVNFDLTLDNTVIYGFARFECYKKPGSKFKIISWKDDF